tara:strand:+ start:307 stop:1317 length:1011 start_codon:yes stop_codon:yes gene_type:complete
MSPKVKSETKDNKNLDLAISMINKKYGEGTIKGVDDVNNSVESISTGCLSLDIATGIGGVPRGRIVEIYGPESSGKTTLALHIIAEAQKEGGFVAYIDTEHALDMEYAKNIGVDDDDTKMKLSQPNSGEDALEIVDILVQTGEVDVIVVDSVAALVPRAELEGEMGDSHMGLQARLMSQALRKLTATVSRSRTCVIFINQLRMKIGVMFGSPETTTGGRALPFYSSMRMDIRRIQTMKDGSDAFGNRTKVKIVKNKVGPPFKLAEFDIIYGEGISYEGDLLDLAVQGEIINKTGSWFSYNDEKIGQGRENVKNLLVEDGKLRKEIESKVKSWLDID